MSERKDGSYRLVYSTKNDIEYKSYSERQWTHTALADFDMFGLQRSQWQDLLSCDATIQAALTYDEVSEAEQRKHQLNQVRKAEMMYALRNRTDPDNHRYADREYKGKTYADFLTVQSSDGVGKVNEQTAICSAVLVVEVVLCIVCM